jgi:hypothetical protein
MTAFQVILVLALVGLLAGTAVGWVKRWASRAVLAAWGGLWIVGLLAVCQPDATTRVAAMMGIRRGADLLLYCSSLAMLAGFFMMYVRLRRVRSDLTILTRQVAIMTAHEGRVDSDRNPNGREVSEAGSEGGRGDAETFLKTLDGAAADH